jgi:predicted RNase H-like nuclease (RuvC/YqgF family)
MPREIVDSLDKDELSQYDEEVQQKLKQMKKIYHDERREKEQILREQQEAVAYAKRVSEENKRIKQMLHTGEQEYVDNIKTTAEMSVEMAKKAYKEAYESGDTDLVVDAQQKLQEANLRLMQAKNFKPTALQEKSFEVQTQPEQYQSVPKPDNRAVAWQKNNAWFGQIRS